MVTNSETSRPAASQPRITFITNFAPHYRVRTFELIAQRYDARFVYYSRGGEVNWLREHGVSTGQFRHEYLRGFSVARIRIAPKLIPLAWFDDADIVIKCINGKFALPVVFSACAVRRRPLIIWTGDWSVTESPAHRASARFNHLVYQRADAVVTYGSHVTQYLTDQGICEDKIFTSKHAVTNSDYACAILPEAIAALRKRLEIPDCAKIVLFVGRLVPIKGLQYLIHGFAQVCRERDCYLLLAGTGPDLQTLQNTVQQLGIANRVRFPGYVRREETVAFYAACYAFVLPSVTLRGAKETWGLVVNEAFNQGVPVIATDAVGAAAGGLVRDGENGFVVPERDSAAIAGALRRLIGDEDLRSRLSMGAKRSVESWDQADMVDAFFEAIEYVLRKRPARRPLAARIAH